MSIGIPSSVKICPSFRAASRVVCIDAIRILRRPARRWRETQDSNLRTVSGFRLSKPVHSAALPISHKGPSVRAAKRLFRFAKHRKENQPVWAGWGGRCRTCSCGSQSPMPSRLATPHHPPAARTVHQRRGGRARLFRAATKGRTRAAGVAPANAASLYRLDCWPHTARLCPVGRRAPMPEDGHAARLISLGGVAQ